MSAFCNQFVRSTERTSDTAVALHIDGGETCSAELRFLRLKRRKPPKISVSAGSGEELPRASAGPITSPSKVPANGRLILRWE